MGYEERKKEFSPPPGRSAWISAAAENLFLFVVLWWNCLCGVLWAFPSHFCGVSRFLWGWRHRPLLAIRKWENIIVALFWRTRIREINLTNSEKMNQRNSFFCCWNALKAHHKVIKYPLSKFILIFDFKKKRKRLMACGLANLERPKRRNWSRPNLLFVQTEDKAKMTNQNRRPSTIFALLWGPFYQPSTQIWGLRRPKSPPITFSTVLISFCTGTYIGAILWNLLAEKYGWQIGGNDTFIGY